MRVAFYLDTFDKAYWQLAQLAIEGLRKAMPGVTVVHLTTANGPTLVGLYADEELRLNISAAYPRNRILIQSAVLGEVLFLDVDMLVQHDLSDVWKQDFDVAMPVVDDPFVKYTGGVCFMRNPDFWKEWLRHDIWKRPFESREHLQAFTQWVDEDRYKVLRLSHDQFECVPTHRWSDTSLAWIVHYRGPRKWWFPGMRHGLGG